MNEERARELLPVRKDGDNGLGPSYGHYMAWSTGDDKITLDCEFTVEELEAIVWWMKNKKQ